VEVEVVVVVVVELQAAAEVVEKNEIIRYYFPFG
jgi:hypothetical protein